jgi:hypothetical protein
MLGLPTIFLTIAASFLIRFAVAVAPIFRHMGVQDDATELMPSCSVADTAH